MKLRARKLVGTVLVLVSLVIYSAIALQIGLLWVTAWPTAAQLAYFAVAGLGWMVPAGWIILWMSKPDE